MRTNSPLLLAILSASFQVAHAAPTAVSDAVAATEDTLATTTFSVLDNDVTTGPALTATLLDPPSNGFATLNSAGVLTYIPERNFVGVDTLTYVANETDDQPVVFTVDPTRSEVEFEATINDPDFGSRTDSDDSSLSGFAIVQLNPARPPFDEVDVIDFEFILEDGADLRFNFGFFVGALNVDVADQGIIINMETPGSSTDIDPDTDQFSQTGNDARISGTAEISASGTIGLIFEDTVTPIDAVESIDITDATLIADGDTYTLTIPITFVSSIPVDDTRSVDVALNGQIVATGTAPPLPTVSEPATVTIDVTATNDGPVPFADTFATGVGQTLVRSAGNGVLENDIDLDGNPLTVSLLTPPPTGTLDLSPDGSFTYTPPPGFAGSTSFTYSVTDSRPPEQVTLMALGSTWRYLDDGTDQGVAWRAPEFDDSNWQSGAAELGYGESGQSTTISDGGDPDNRTPTYYFRSSFEVVDPAATGPLQAFILRDDAAAVYINGVEVFRDTSLPPDAAFDVFASASATENVFVAFPVPPEVVEQGTNHVAVEVHQSGPTSTDVAFDFYVNATLPTYAPVVPAGSNWRYLDDGSDQMTAWREPVFDDSTWESGPARLGYGEPQIVTVVDFGGASDNKFATTYFRHTFELSSTSTIQAAAVHLLVDDGTAVYLNGTEIARINLDPDATFDTFADGSAGGVGEHTFTTVIFDPSLLQPGTNTLAAEVHQSGGKSSDLAFDLELSVSFAPAIATATITVEGEPGADSDNDGMLDAYEELYGLVVGVDDSALDPDGDLRTNLEEFLAGTDPNDPGSALAIAATGLSPDGSTLTVTFGSVPGVTYQLQKSDDLETWSPVPDARITATTSESSLSFTVPDGLATSHLRVVVQ